MGGGGEGDRVEFFVAAVRDADGPERANYQLFVQRLCRLLDVAEPGFARAEAERNDYVFERRVDFVHPDGSRTPGFIDCYKRGSFVLEAKQSGKRAARAGGAASAWDQVMLEARRQAENYARALPVADGYPPFLVVVDVGRAIELFADFSGQGKNYAHFPDRARYRIRMEDLREEAVRERLRLVFEDPRALDPARESARVTSDVAARLARIAKRLETRHDAKEVAEFLMRCLFTMFAEDVGLLPEHAFRDLLGRLRAAPDSFVPAVESLWRAMDEGTYEPHVMATLRHFNGTLFKTRRALPLDPDEIAELHAAAERNWSEVEPAIFGTLLERALDPRERAALGAHYTPRAYVERLVVPTIIEPLRAEWDVARGRAGELERAGDVAGAIEIVRGFHHRLCTVRVLDPACGTGNFLYVALEMTKRLEGEVLEALDALGEGQGRLAMEGETVSPRQFHGLEINPRAVPIAELVLWIGYLNWQLRTGGPGAVGSPVLHAYGTVRAQDALLAYDRKVLARDAAGAPVTRWDGVTTMPHPVTGEPVPDPAARVEVYTYANPRRAEWPQADFIVGNPPFIGGKDLRAQLGDGYAQALWAVRPHVPGGADLVMHFWDEAASRLRAAAPVPDAPRKAGKGRGRGLAQPGGRVERFGFITTNSIVQTFSRRVIERHRGGDDPLRLAFAIPDHPWLKSADRAAVRIAMTVCARGPGEGVLAKVVSEAELDTDTPLVELSRREGVIAANLAIGADLGSTTALLANEALSSPGVKLHGAGFIVTPEKAEALGLGTVEGLDAHILPYRNGRDLTGRPRGVMVIDLYPLGVDEVRDRFPAVYQHVKETVKPERDLNNRAYRRDNWWLFGENIPKAREALFSIPHYIATVETAKHRTFQFLDAGIRPDNMLVAIGLSSAEHLAVLSSRVHVAWSLAAGGWLGVGNDPRYSKTRTFDPFPFPAALSADTPLRTRLRTLGERLDALRKERLARHPELTMTGLYNALERLRAIETGADPRPLDAEERAVHAAGLVAILGEIHDAIDRAVLEAYGFDDLAPALVGRPGATTPCAHVAPEQAAAEEELLVRLVALNRARAAEEARGLVRWLRPDFQVPRLAARLPQAQQGELPDLEIVPAVARLRWPADGLDQIRIVREVLSRAPAPVIVDAVAVSFEGRASRERRARVAAVLDTLVATGSARIAPDGRRYFVPR